MYIMIYHVLIIHSSRAKNAAFADLAAAVAAHRMHAVVAICERHVACEQLPGIANRQWYSVERYTSQALPSAAKRAIGLLSTRLRIAKHTIAKESEALISIAKHG